jgi:hypothetical protein
MKINKEWHEAHRLPRNAGLDERLDWHVQHAANCGCREMPATIKAELEARGWTLPSARSLK